MTKLKPKDFAQLLLEITEQKSNTGLKEFVELVYKKRMQGEMKEIIAEYQNLYNKANGIIEATVTTANRLDEASLKSLALSLKQKYGAKEIEVIEKVDQRLIGGIKVKVGDTVHDASLGHALNQLHKQLAA